MMTVIMMMMMVAYFDLSGGDKLRKICKLDIFEQRVIACLTLAVKLSRIPQLTQTYKVYFAKNKSLTV